MQLCAEHGAQEHNMKAFGRELYTKMRRCVKTLEEEGSQADELKDLAPTKCEAPAPFLRRTTRELLLFGRHVARNPPLPRPGHHYGVHCDKWFATAMVHG